MAGKSLSATLSSHTVGGVLYNQITCYASGFAGDDVVIYISSENGYNNVSYGLSAVFDTLNNGTYAIYAEGSIAGATSTKFIYADLQVIAPVVCDIAVGDIIVSAETSLGANDGTATITATSSAGGLQMRFYNTLYSAFLSNRDWKDIASGVPKSFTNLTPGYYQFEVRDGNGCSLPFFTVLISKFEVWGCTDPEATNYDPSATSNDGTCDYTPAEPQKYFRVPFVNSLHFVIPEDVNNCSALATPDNQLFYDQKHRGVVGIGYNQKVAKCDVLTIQFHSNYESHLVELLTASGELLANLGVELKASFTSKTANFETFAQDNRDGRTRIYFEQSSFSANLGLNQIITLSNNDLFAGNYGVKAIGQDSAGANPYFVINKPYTSTFETEGVTLSAEYNEFPYNVYELTFDASAYAIGAYQLKIIAMGSDAVFAISEPFEIVREDTEGLYLVQFYNLKDSFGVHYTTNIRHSVRVEANLFHAKTGGEREVYREPRLVKLSASKTRLRDFETYMLPPYLHEKLGVVFDCDVILINGVKYQTEEAYEPEYLTRYPLANGAVVVEQVAWLDAENSNDEGETGSSSGNRIIVNGGFLKY